jgi:N-acetylmuramoyl-L-alanine amidase
MKPLRVVAILLAAGSIVATGMTRNDAIRLNVTYPPHTIETRYPQVRIAGSCDPSCTLSIQGTPTKVYPTGAFVGLVPLEEGENCVEVVAKRGEKNEKKRITVICKDPLVTSPISPLSIDATVMEPSADVTLQPGDTLHMKVKGSPGMKAYWSLGELVKDGRLKEEPPAQDGPLKGIAGIYTGTYRVEQGDSIEREKVRFRIVSQRKKSVEAFSPCHVTLLPSERLTRAVVGDRGAVVSIKPEDRREWKLKPGARINLCGDSGGYYRVKFSSSERFWVPKESVELVGGKGGWDVAHAGRLKVSESTGGTRLFLPLEGEPPLRVRQYPKKRVLEVDIFGTTGISEKLTLKRHGPVRAVKVENGRDNTVRVAVYLQDQQQWGYSCSRTPKGVFLKIKGMPGKKLERMTVVVDPGHGGRDKGAVSPTGLLEKDVNLDIARALQHFLEGRGARVVLTRDKDVSISLKERIEIARRAGADIFISVHNNSLAGHVDPLARRGSDCYFGVPQSKASARSILNELGDMRLKRNGCHKRNFAVVLPTDYVAVLVECAFMSHPEDEALLLRKGFRIKIGKAIGEGIIDFVQHTG